MSFKEELVEFIKKNGISQNKAAEGMGYAGSVMSQWLGGTYKGNMEEVESAARSWYLREKNRRSKKAIPVVNTEAMIRIQNAINIAHEEKDIAVIVGDAGTGKTTAIREYLKENPHSTVVIEVDATFSKRIFMQELAKALDLDPRGGMSELTARITSKLAERDTVVVCDEADYLNDTTLELARRVINDKGKSGLVLVGLPRLEFKIKNLKNDHQQLASRVGVLLHVDGIREADAEKIVRGVWPNLTKDIIKALYKVSGPSIRRLSKLIDRAHRTACANNMTEPDLEAVQMAGELILQ